MLYPGIDHKYTSSIFEEHSDDFKKINEFQILDFSICGYMPCSLLVPFFELHFRNYNFLVKYTSMIKKLVIGFQNLLIKMKKNIL